MSAGWAARLRAWAQGELPTRELEAFRVSGGGVHEVLLAADRLHEELRLRELGVWTAPPAACTQLLATWCAQALQALANALLDGADQADPATPGYVPEPVRGLALACYLRAELWVVRAREAAANPAYRLREPLPDRLPAWTWHHPCPDEHLPALLAGAAALRDPAGVLVAEAVRSAGTPHRPYADLLHQRRAATDTKAEQAWRLWAEGAATGAPRWYVEERAYAAIAEWYVLGQHATMPGLMVPARPGRAATSLGPVDAQIRALAQRWMSQDSPHGPLARLHYTGEITHACVHWLSREWYRRRGVPYGDAPPVTPVDRQLDQLLRYCIAHGPRPPVEHWWRLPSPRR